MQESNSFRYQMVTTSEYVEDSGTITTYGISFRNRCEIGGDCQENEEIISNISTRSAFVKELVDKLNRSDADPIHLHDFIYDSLP